MKTCAILSQINGLFNVSTCMLQLHHFAAKFIVLTSGGYSLHASTFPVETVIKAVVFKGSDVPLMLRFTYNHKTGSSAKCPRMLKSTLAIVFIKELH